MTRPDPFSTPEPAEVPLPRAPLPLVVVQLRFPVIAAFSKLDAIAPVQEALSERYPILRPEQATSIVVGPQGIQVQAGEGKIWRFFDRSGQWRVSLATEFVALETRAYVDRRDFIARLRAVLEALPRSARPAVYERLGLRFVNRLKGADVEVLPALVQPELLGIGGSPIAARAVHSLTETSFAIGDDGVNARWGLLPPGGTPDPATIEAVPERRLVARPRCLLHQAGRFLGGCGGRADGCVRWPHLFAVPLGRHRRVPVAIRRRAMTTRTSSVFESPPAVSSWAVGAVVFVAGAFTLGAATASTSIEGSSLIRKRSAWTSSGASSPLLHEAPRPAVMPSGLNSPPTTAALVLGLRRLSGLTWDQPRRCSGLTAIGSFLGRRAPAERHQRGEARRGPRAGSTDGCRRPESHAHPPPDAHALGCGPSRCPAGG